MSIESKKLQEETIEFWNRAIMDGLEAIFDVYQKYLESKK